MNRSLWHPNLFFLGQVENVQITGVGENNREYVLFSDMQCHCITLVIQNPRNHTPTLDCIVTSPAWYTWSTLSTHDLGPPYSSLLCPLTSVAVLSIGRESGSLGICPLCLFHHHSVTQGNLESACPNMSTVKIFCFSPPFLSSHFPSNSLWIPIALSALLDNDIQPWVFSLNFSINKLFFHQNFKFKGMNSAFCIFITSMGSSPHCDSSHIVNF